MEIPEKGGRFREITISLDGRANRCFRRIISWSNLAE